MGVTRGLRAGGLRIRPDHAHMCVSDPGLVKQIIEDWKAKGAPEFLNVCENDGWAACVCDRCMSWDVPDPDNAVPFDKRLEAAKNVFKGAEGTRADWPLQLGSLSDRYARFWHNVAAEAVKIRPDVKVVSYVYDNYRKAPIKATLSANVLCGIVPGQTAVGYGKADSGVFPDTIGRSGCGKDRMRPVPSLTQLHTTLQARQFSRHSYARNALGEDLKFGHGPFSERDRLRFAHQQVFDPGLLTLYMLAEILNHPDASVDSVIDDYYSAFGPAKGYPAVKR